MRVPILDKLDLYNPAIARFLSVDPLTSSYPYYTPYQFAGNTPIKFIDLDGLEPALPGTENGEIQKATVQGHDEWGQRDFAWDGENWGASPLPSAPEVTGQRSNASPEWKEFISNVGVSRYKDFTNSLYESKLSSYTYPSQLNLALYGTNSDGSAAVPNSIKSRLRSEAESEAMPALKNLWASQESGVNPNSIRYQFDPFQRTAYLSTLALTVSSTTEGLHLASTTALQVATAWYGGLSLTNQNIDFRKYPGAGGGGVNFYINNRRSVGLDYHKIGKSQLYRPHIDIHLPKGKGKKILSHWPFSNIR